MKPEKIVTLYFTPPSLCYEWTAIYLELANTFDQPLENYSILNDESEESKRQFALCFCRF